MSQKQPVTKTQTSTSKVQPESQKGPNSSQKSILNSNTIADEENQQKFQLEADMDHILNEEGKKDENQLHSQLPLNQSSLERSQFANNEYESFRPFKEGSSPIAQNVPYHQQLSTKSNNLNSNDKFTTKGAPYDKSPFNTQKEPQLIKLLDKKDKPIPEDDDIGKEKEASWWPIEIGSEGPGKSKSRSKLRDMLGLNKNDVYPLNISYNALQKLRMMFWRYLSILILIWVFIPFDLYIPSHKYRTGYYGTDLNTFTIPFSGCIKGQYLINVTNCEVHFYPTSNYSSNDKSLAFQYSVSFGTKVYTSANQFSITASPDNSCIINLYVPTDNTQLPDLTFTFQGFQDNIVFDDVNLQGQVLNFGNNLQITGNSVFINLNNHIVTNLKINVAKSLCYLNNFQAKNKLVNIGIGLYSEYIPPSYASNQVTVNQPYGFICLYSPAMTSTSYLGPACPVTDAQLNAQITVIDPKIASTYTCQVKALMCANSYLACPPTPTISSTINVTVADGPVQLRFEDSLNSWWSQSYSFTRFAVTTNYNSYKFLNTSKLAYTNNPQQNIITNHQTAGVDYQRSWIYTNTEAYIQAQYWPLIFASGTLLKPEIVTEKVVIMDNQCPGRRAIFALDTAVSNMYTDFYDQNDFTIIVFIQGFSNFYQIISNTNGDAILQQVVFSSSSTVVAAFGISGAIAFLGALFFVYLSYVASKIAKKVYDGYIVTKKSISFTRQLVKTQEQPQGAPKEKDEKASKQLIFEDRGLFYSKYAIRTVNKDKELTYKFSIFQLPVMYLDYYLRKNSNSLKEFLNRIQESKSEFTPGKMKQAAKEDISIKYGEFMNYYHDFCQKFEYQELQFEGNSFVEETFKEFGIKFDTQPDKLSPAYINIRFKTNIEKAKKVKGSSGQNTSTVAAFLASECVSSHFDDDYIFYEDLNEKYEAYCILKDIEKAKIESIIGSQEMLNFGCLIKNIQIPAIIIGVKTAKMVLANEEDAEDIATDKIDGLIKMPKKNKKNGCAGLLEIDGFLPNLILVATHFIMICAIPLIVPLFAYIALSGMTQFQDNIYAMPLTFTDFASPNRLRPWWQNIPYLNGFTYAQIFPLYFLLVAIFELVSFYNTGYKNQGRFPVIFSIPKNIIYYQFKFCLFVFLFLYFLMIWFVLVWAILATVINPTAYLPYATASTTLIGTIAIKQKQLRDWHNKIKQQLDEIIDNAFKMMMQEGINKLRRLAMQKEDDKEDSNDKNKDDLKKEINAFTNGTVAALFKEPMWNHESKLAEKVSPSMEGIHPEILSSTMAVIAGKKTNYFESLDKLSTLFKIDGNNLKRISEISLSKFNPDNQGNNDSSEVVVSIKNLFRNLFPSMNIDIIGEIIKTVTEGNSKNLIKFFEKFDPPKDDGDKDGKKDKKPVKDEAFIETFHEVFQIMIHTLLQDKIQLRDKTITFFEKLVTKQDGEKGLKQLFTVLQQLSEGNLSGIKYDIESTEQHKLISDIVGFKKNFPITSLIAFSQNSQNLTREIITLFFQELCGQEQAEVSTAFMLGFYNLINGTSIDMRKIGSNIQKQNLKINVETLNTIHLASQKSKRAFRSMIFKLDCVNSKEFLLELFEITQLKDFNPIEICQFIRVPVEKSKVFLNLIYLLHHITKHEILCDKLRDLKHLKSDASPEQSQSIKQQKLQLKLQIQTLVEFIDEILNLIKDQEDLKFNSVIDAFANDNYDAVEPTVTFESLSSYTDYKVPRVLPPQKKKRGGGGGVVFEKLLTFENLQHILSKKENGQILWQQVISMKQFDYLTPDMKILLRSYAITILRTEGLLESDDLNFQKCIKYISELFNAQQIKVEFLIDTINGSPVEIFKVSGNKLTTNSEKNTISGKFDQARMQMLSEMLHASESTLTNAFIQWYNQYLMVVKGQEITPIILKTFNLKHDFADIISISRINQSGDHASNDNETLVNLIRQFVGGALQSKYKEQNGIIRKKEGLPYNTVELFQQSVPQPLGFAASPIFLDIISKILSVKLRDTPTLKQMIGLSENQMKIFKSILDQQNNVTPHSVLDCIIEMSQYIPMFQMQDNTGFMDFTLWDNIEVGPKGRHSFIQFCVLLNSFQFSTMCQTQEIDKFYMNQSMEDMFEIANDCLSIDDKIIKPDSSDFTKFVRTLYENDYFQEIANLLFKQLNVKESFQDFQELSPKHCNNILGMMLGAAIGDEKIIRTSMINLLGGHEIDLQVLNAVMASIVLDSEAIADIVALCKNLDLESDLLLQVMELMKNQAASLPTLIQKLMKGLDPDQINICTSMIGASKGEVSKVRPIADIFGVQMDLLVSVLAAAKGDLEILSDSYQTLATQFGLENYNSVKVISEISNGDNSSIQNLSNKRSLNFLLDQSQLVESLVYMTYSGKALRHEKTKHYDDIVGYLDKSVTNITKKLQQVLNIDLFNAMNFKQAVETLLAACWGDHKSLEILYQRLVDANIRKSIWLAFQYNKDSQNKGEFSEDGLRFLKNQLRLIPSNQEKLIAKLEKAQKKKITELTKIILPIYNLLALKDRQADENDQLKDLQAKYNAQDYIKQQKAPAADLQQAVITQKFGCTFSTSLDKTIPQLFFMCLTCNSQEDNEFLGICAICADECHKGHKLAPGNMGQITRVVCDCVKINHTNTETKKDQACSCLRKNIFEAIQLEASKNRVYTKTMNKSLAEEDYSYQNFIEDISRALELPEFFVSNQDGIKGLLENNPLKKVFDPSNGYIKFEKKDVDSEDVFLSYLRDEYLGYNISLAENLMLMAHGLVTDSFVTLLSSKKEYTEENYLSQSIYPTKKPINQQKLSSFRTMRFFVSIAQGDSTAFKQHCQGFVEVMRETGSKELPASDKLYSILKLNFGGKVSYKDPAKKTGLKPNHYVLTFKKLFGIQSKKVILLHKFLTLTSAKVVKVLGLNEAEFDIIEADSDHMQEIKTFARMIDKNLFNEYLMLDEKAKKSHKNILRISNGDLEGFDYIALEKKQDAKQIPIYKALLSKDYNQLSLVLEDLEHSIPHKIGKHLLSILQGDKSSIISMINSFIVIHNRNDKNWNIHKDGKADKEYNYFKDKKQKQKNKNNEFLNSIFSLTFGETQRDKKNIESVLKQLFPKHAQFANGVKKTGPQTTFLMQALPCLSSIEGVFYDNQFLIPEVMEMFNPNDKRKSLAKSLITLVNTSAWDDDDLRNIIYFATNQTQNLDAFSPIEQVYFRDFINALDGDLVGLSKILDEVINSNDTHFRSLLVGLVTGNTKYDLIENEETRMQHMNLIKREMYGVFEKIFISQNLEQDNLNNMIQTGFSQNLPLLFFFLLTGDESFISKIFNIEKELSLMLKDDLKTTFKGQDDKGTQKNLSTYIQQFVKFLDPVSQITNINNLLQYATKDIGMKDPSISINKMKFPGLDQLQLQSVKADLPQRIYQNLQKDMGANDSQGSLKIDVKSAIKLLLNTIRLDKNSAVNVYNIFNSLFDQSLGLQNIFSLVYKLLQEKRTEIFVNLPAIVQVIVKSLRKKNKDALNEQEDPVYDALFINTLCNWMESIFIMLDKENKYPSDEENRSKFITMITNTLACYKAKQPADDPDQSYTHPYIKKLENVPEIVDVLIGVMSMCQQDYPNMAGMCLKIGGFPHTEEGLEFFNIVKKNYNSVSFESLALTTAVKGTPKDDKDKKNGDSGEIKVDPKALFEHFSAQNNGYIGFEQFKAVCKQLGLKKLSKAKQLAIFGSVDFRHTGELNLLEFTDAIEEVKLFIILEIIYDLGVSTTDLLVSFIMTIILMILMFVFIFIGISAFSPMTSFSSVTNSFLPLTVGGAAVKKDDKSDSKDNSKHTEYKKLVQAKLT